MAGQSESTVAVRAYEIWEKQGRPHGRDREHWLQAVAELSAHPAKPKTLKLKAPPAAKAAPARANGNGRPRKG